MSYLDPPRFHFSGTFFTDPSTINNSTENYSPTIEYNNNPPTDVNPNSVWWNQYGQAFFKVKNCSVTAAMGDDRVVITSSSQDPIIGAEVISVITGEDNAQFARLADMDPDQQARSLIVGLALRITTSDGGSLTGVIRPMNILDIWGRVIGGSGSGIESAGAMYQSIVEDLAWHIDTTSSSILQQLYQVSPTTLSFKMAVDGYNGQASSDQFTSGRLVGTIGPYVTGEPASFVARRKMFTGAEAVQQSYPTPSQPSPMNSAPFQLDGSTLTIDLGNSVPTTAVRGGPFKELGPVQVVLDPLGQNLTLGTLYETAAQFAAQYALTAGIYELPLGGNAGAASGKPLALRISPPTVLAGAIAGLPAVRLKEGLLPAQSGSNPQPGPPGPSIALAERENGYYADVSHNFLRMERGAPPWDAAADDGMAITRTAQVTVTATQWGQRVNGLAIAVSTTQNQYQFRNEDGEFYPINNDPMSAVTVSPAALTTGTTGEAVITFTANGLTAAQKPARREFVDGQLYLFTHAYTMDPLQPITLLMFEDTPPVAAPTWWQNVYPILMQYARLYPFMRSLIDLSDYGSVTNTTIGIPQKMLSALNLPMAHPGYMPVTRDLSLGRRQIINDWYAQGMAQGTPPSKAGGRP